MSNVTAIIIYVAGIVVGAIGMGAFIRPGSRVVFDGLDYAMFICLIVFWPLVLVVLVGVALPAAIVIGALYHIVKFLMKVGEFIAQRVDLWMYHRRIAREANADEDAQN